MPPRADSHETRPPLRSGASEPAKSRVRIGRACDRCKVKKSKCDGNTPCSTCVASDSTCEYSARRRREARDWYWGMQDVIDEALQRLYWACREGRGFPGVVPDESSGRVSTDAILRGLGLSPPPVENTRPSGPRSESILDRQAELLVPRSYHPPDIGPPKQGPSRTLTTSSVQTPLSASSEDRLTFGEGISESELRARGDSGMDVDEEEDDMPDDNADTLPEGLADSLPDGLTSELQGSIDAEFNAPLTQDELAGYMGGAMYHSSMGMMSDPRGLASGTHGGQGLAQFAVPSLNQQRLESVTQSLGTVEHEVWQGRHDSRTEDALPWPGNMASVYRRGRPGEGRGGFGGGGAGQR